MAKRKAISKSIRFEVFKRDRFACQYCGNSPPDVVLQVDHFIPVADGGTNEITNLVTSCIDCNSGKSDKRVDDVIDCDSVAEIQLEKIAQLSAFNKMLRESVVSMQDDMNWLRDYVANSLGWKEISDQEFCSLKVFSQKLPISEIVNAADITGSKHIASNYSRWKYFCGICWNRINKK